MKTKYSFFLVLLAGLTACSNPDISMFTPSSVLASAPSTISIAKDVTSGSFDVTSNSDWSISGVPSWMTLSATSGRESATITYHMDVNPSCTESRSATLTLNSSNLAIPMVFVQPAATEYLKADSSYFWFPSDGGKKTFHVSSNSTWSIQVEYADAQGWITPSVLEGSRDAGIGLTVASNMEEEDRLATVTIVSAGGLKQMLTIGQALLYKPMPSEDDNEDPGL